MKKIRLVIFDMGFTLWDEVEDSRAIIKNEGPKFYKIDEDHMFRYEGIANEIYPGVRELFEELYKRNVFVSINSLNVEEADRWIEEEFYNLNKYGQIKYSVIGNPPGGPIPDAHKTGIKGEWTKQIIDSWNKNETKDDLIQNEQVLFVDDNYYNQKFVKKSCPGINCVYPVTFEPRGMLHILDFIEELESEK